MTGEEFTEILLVNTTIVIYVDELESLPDRELCLLLRQDTELLGLDFILQVRCPSLEEQLSRLRTKYLLPSNTNLLVHWCFFRKQISME